MRPRDTYADVGAAERAAIEQALVTAGPRGLSREARVLLAALHQTASWSRVSDRVFQAALLELARVERRAGQRALHDLAARGVLVWRPSRSPGRPSLLGLPGSVPVDNPLLNVLPDVERAVDTSTFGRLHRPPYREGPRREQANIDSRPCAVCGQVTLLGSVYGTLWFCDRHPQAA